MGSVITMTRSKYAACCYAWPKSIISNANIANISSVPQLYDGVLCMRWVENYELGGHSAGKNGKIQ